MLRTIAQDSRIENGIRLNIYNTIQVFAKYKADLFDGQVLIFNNERISCKTKIIKYYLNINSKININLY